MLMRSDPFRDLDRWATQALGGRTSPRAMPMDAYRRGDRVFVHFDLPGVDPATINLTVEKNALSISAERKWDLEEGAELIVSERPQGTFSRQLFLGEALDLDRVEAHYDAGVLTVIVPVAEQAKPRRIEVGSTSTPEAISQGAAN